MTEWSLLIPTDNPRLISLLRDGKFVCDLAGATEEEAREILARLNAFEALAPEGDGARSVFQATNALRVRVESALEAYVRSSEG